MKAWWNSLSSREQVMLGVGGCVVCLGALYFLLWASLLGRLERLREVVPEKRAELTWMREAAAEVGRLVPGVQGGSSPGGGGSVMAVIDKTAKQSGLSKKLKRIEPDGENGAKVWMEEAEFDAIMGWTNLLEEKNAIRVTTFSVEPLSERSGYVKARLTLVGMGQ